MSRVRSWGGPALWGLLVGAACGGVVDTGTPEEPPRADASDRPPGNTDPPPSNPTCGNGRIDPGEACDRSDSGGATCTSATMGTSPMGHLVCGPRCTVITSDCRALDPPPCCGGAAGTGAGGRATGGMGGMGGMGGSAGNGGFGATAGYGGNAGSSYGDPHLFTPDGLEYDFQAVGEFVLLEDRDDPSFVVQVRQAPFRSFTKLSSNAAVAALVGGDRVSFYAGQSPPSRVEGVPRTVSGSLDLSHGGRIVNEKETYTVSWPSGEAVIVSATWGALLNISYRPAPNGKRRRLHGLLGTPDGDPGNDLTTRTGEMLLSSGNGNEIYEVFGKSWRVTQAESLFDYGPGEDTRAFTDLGFPYGERTTAALPPSELKAAYLTCVLAGVADVAALEACTTDVALTGDAGFAHAAAAHGAAKTPTIPASSR